MAGRRSLEERLQAAGVELATPAWDAWRRLRAAEGPRATGIDLFTLVARERGMLPQQLSQSERSELAKRANHVLWPGFEHIPSAVADSGRVEVVSYDPGWPALFVRWRLRLEQVLGAVALRVDHIGSTSVPGLAAKPIVDILVCVRDPQDEAAYVGAIESLGVAFRSRDELHRYFRPAAGHPYDVHVHVTAWSGAFARDHLLFRDYLRRHPEAREAYASDKRAAAGIWADDRWAYTEAKTGIILDLMEVARRWAAATGWEMPPPEPGRLPGKGPDGALFKGRLPANG